MGWRSRAGEAPATWNIGEGGSRGAMRLRGGRATPARWAARWRGGCEARRVRRQLCGGSAAETTRCGSHARQALMGRTNARDAGGGGGGSRAARRTGAGGAETRRVGRRHGRGGRDQAGGGDRSISIACQMRAPKISMPSRGRSIAACRATREPHVMRNISRPSREASYVRPGGSITGCGTSENGMSRHEKAFGPIATMPSSSATSSTTRAQLEATDPVRCSAVVVV